MENGALIGLSRQIALQRELDVVANNVANMSTNGFKADQVVFHEYLMPVASANQFRGTDRRMSFVQDRATWHDLGQGPVEVTGNPLDVTISGNAFFAVQTPNGERYTRNGAFQINATGELVTSEGHRVIGESGPIVFQQGDRNIAISSDGTISVREGKNTTDTLRGKLRLASFAAPSRLQKDGTTTFVAPEGVAAGPADNTVRLTQGSIEKSNVKSVVEMTRLIEVTRSYTQIASVLQNQSDMRRSAIEKLAEVPA